MKYVSQAVDVIRQRVNDTLAVNYTIEEIINNIDTACRFLGLTLIARRAPEMIASESAVDYSAVPKGFHSFVGQFPVWREGAVLRTSTGNIPVEIRYFCTREGVSLLEDKIPYSDDYFDVIVTVAASLLLNRDEFDTSSEKAMIDAIGTLLPKG